MVNFVWIEYDSTAFHKFLERVTGTTFTGMRFKSKPWTQVNTYCFLNSYSLPKWLVNYDVVELVLTYTQTYTCMVWHGSNKGSGWASCFEFVTWFNEYHRLECKDVLDLAIRKDIHILYRAAQNDWAVSVCFCSWTRFQDTVICLAIRHPSSSRNRAGGVEYAVLRRTTVIMKWISLTPSKSFPRFMLTVTYSKSWEGQWMQVARWFTIKRWMDGFSPRNTAHFLKININNLNLNVFTSYVHWFVTTVQGGIDLTSPPCKKKKQSSGVTETVRSVY